MTADADVADNAPKKGGKLPLIIGLVLAIVGGAGGFLAVQAGLLGGSESTAKEAPTDTKDAAAATVYFVAIDPLVISLPSSGGRDHLRFAAQLEVVPAYVAEVEAIKPRVVDVLNGYLRSVDLAELEDPAALIRLRAQMLRRVQVVTGEGRVNDLLIMEFVLS
ncbi:flagellar basal body-associated FliL family protein [Yoonia sp. F2084L]|uniref:flagellar basal body-associated FliL family protein n=1 Tax=Yoonia sp. F2084L TaxID=2926419 RepID=UPI001FF28236|nr:flagellar basal body-associated FliL family protein [Yoonia sp. F2084L]MCK0095765.1 flagellar basal body-associated FliL family protein [Yoonia sp. F2084L]